MRRPSADAVRHAMPATARPLVEAVVAQADAWSLGVHLVGGPVRDLLLGRALRDVDLVIEPAGGRGAVELARAVAAEGARCVAHPRFGTARLEAEGARVDLATARAEHYERPGALPAVRPGTLEEDLLRRDFTVNALALPLSAAARSGRPAVLDPSGGVRDLGERVLRILHPRSFHDDPTRALRAARLAPRLGLRPARATRSALRSALRDGAFGAVTGERLRAELEKLFADAALGLDPAQALRLLGDWHVLAAVEPGLALPRPAVAPLRRLGGFVAEPPWAARAGEGTDRPLVAGLMLWLAPLAAPLRRATLSRLALRGELARRVRGFPTARDGWLRAMGSARGRGATDRVLRGVGEDELLALAAAAPPNERRRILRFAREDRHVRLPVSGDDLLALGLSGPALGRALARIRSAVLDRAVRSRDEALALAAELARPARRSSARRSRRAP